MPDQLNTALLMYISYRDAENRIFAHLVAAGFDDFTLAQGRLMARVAEGGSRISDLAEQAQITKQTAGFLVDQLQAAGYVTREPDPTDKRARLVTIAERGHAAQRAAREIEQRVEKDWEAHLGKRRMDTLRSLLSELREITDPYR